MRSTRVLPDPSQAELDRFWAKTMPSDNGCVIWTAAVFQNTGYGQFGFRRKPITAHRFAYRAVRGPIADALVIDHLCRNRLCVNPDHLEAVTDSVNNQRGLNGDLRDKSWHDEVRRLHSENPQMTCTEIAGRVGRSLGGVWQLLNPDGAGERTHCRRGHEFSEDNTYRAPNGTRVCRTCKAERYRRWAQTNRPQRHPEIVS